MKYNLLYVKALFHSYDSAAKQVTSSCQRYLIAYFQCYLANNSILKSANN